MKYSELLVLIILVVIVVSSPSRQWKSNCKHLNTSKSTKNCSDHSTCPTWFICGTDKTCQCGNRHGGTITCDNKQITTAVLDCNCVTYDETSLSTFVGSCFYNCVNLKNHNDFVYHRLPVKPELLINTSACTRFHRAGLLCGDCEEGYNPYVLSYNLSCVRCPEGNKNWWKFMLAGFITSYILLFLYYCV